MPLEAGGEGFLNVAAEDAGFGGVNAAEDVVIVVMASVDEGF